MRAKFINAVQLATFKEGKKLKQLNESSTALKYHHLYSGLLLSGRSQGKQISFEVRGLCIKSAKF